jgi:hypothetical protein
VVPVRPSTRWQSFNDSIVSQHMSDDESEPVK